MSIASAGGARAGVWGSQPDVGISADFNTNPALLDLSGTTERHAALVLDGPSSYVADDYKFTMLPSFRLSDSKGYSSLDSDYEHLSTLAELDAERTVLKASAGVARDSSLYHDYILNGATGVRRDTASLDLNGDRRFSELLEFDTDVNAQRVRYAEDSHEAVLTDYRYASIAPVLSWTRSERGALTFSANVGRYDSLDGNTQSRSGSLQLGLREALSEIWSLSASGGYSRANNRVDFELPQLVFTQQGIGIIYVPERAESSQNGSVFVATLARQTETLGITANASRQLVPTGFAFLSRQTTYDLLVNRQASARWTIGGGLHRYQYEQPATNGVGSTLTVSLGNVSASYLLTEHWTLSFAATRVLEHYATPAVTVANTGASLQLTRQFDFKSLP
jgi:hypothetical protein